MTTHPISRRDLLKGLLGRSPEERKSPSGSAREAAPRDLVAAFDDLLRRHADVLAWGVTEAALPADGAKIQEAVLAVASPEMSEAVKERLSHVYSSIPWFCSSAELDLLRAGKAALESLDQSDAGRAALALAFEIRGRILGEVARLSRDFEARLPDQADATKRASTPRSEE